MMKSLVHSMSADTNSMASVQGGSENWQAASDSDLSVSSTALLHKLWHKGTEFLGCHYAILGGAMTWLSDHQLVSGISKAGGFGVLAGGSLSPSDLAQEIQSTHAHAAGAPFGVNLITFHPHIQELLSVCADLKVTHVFLSAGIPSQEQIDTCHRANSKVVGFAPSAAIAKRMVRHGIDALVVEGHEAGGHVGPVSTQVLAQEVIPSVPDTPVFVAGGVGHGKSIASYVSMGAAGCQLGTRFVCATESRAHPHFKQAFINAHARDAIVTTAIDPDFPVIPVRALSNQGHKNFGQFQSHTIQAYRRGEITKDQAQMNIEMFWSGALRRAVTEGDTTHGSLMAGQSVAFVTGHESCQDIIMQLVDQATQYCRQWHERINTMAVA